MNPSHLTRGLTLAVAAGTTLLLVACATPTAPTQPTPPTAPSASTAAPAAPKPAASVAPGATPAAGGIDYAKPETWLCRPGRQDVCAQPLSLTTIAADGTRSVGPALVANARAPIDCFYVYPTVSNDNSGNSDMNAGPEELGVAYSQFSPFRTQCRLYAPLYRQVTVTALRARLGGDTSMKVDAAMAYGDVVAAWRHYLAHDNQGRGVVLIGHSQGSRMLTELMAKEIEGKPEHQRIVSIMPIGANLMVPKGKDVGGSFKSTPLCRSASQTGCAIAYVSFRSSAPPPPNTLFARGTNGLDVACTNPAALAGGEAKARVWHAKRNDVNASTGRGSAQWQALTASVDTPFFAVPGLVSTQCVNDARGSYLAVKVHPDRRSDDIGGDVAVAGNIVANWGLHLIDVHLGLGDLIDIVGQQAQAYVARTQGTRSAAAK